MVDNLGHFGQDREEVGTSLDARAVYFQDLLVVFEPVLLLHSPVRYAVQLVHRRDQGLVRRRRLQTKHKRRDDGTTVGGEAEVSFGGGYKACSNSGLRWCGHNFPCSLRIHKPTDVSNFPK